MDNHFHPDAPFHQILLKNSKINCLGTNGLTVVLAQYCKAGVRKVQFESEDASATCFSYPAINYLSIVPCQSYPETGHNSKTKIVAVLGTCATFSATAPLARTKKKVAHIAVALN